MIGVMLAVAVVVLAPSALLSLMGHYVFRVPRQVANGMVPICGALMLVSVGIGAFFRLPGWTLYLEGAASGIASYELSRLMFARKPAR